MAVRKAQQGKKGGSKNQTHTYHFDVEKCKSCPFKEKAKERYRIEAKNSELKNRHGYDVATSSGLLGMELQGAMAITVNLKRILKLMK
jgi:endogenous inhibitor of DNA gyrase (YacG/DUF329 family)